MAIDNLNQYLTLIPVIGQSPGGSLWSSYYEHGDVLYISFDKPRPATDSELTDDDIIIRYDGDDVIGIKNPFSMPASGSGHSPYTTASPSHQFLRRCPVFGGSGQGYGGYPVLAVKYVDAADIDSRIAEPLGDAGQGRRARPST